jgi:hypothetical protein
MKYNDCNLENKARRGKIHAKRNQRARGWLAGEK